MISRPEHHPDNTDNNSIEVDHIDYIDEHKPIDQVLAHNRRKGAAIEACNRGLITSEKLREILGIPRDGHTLEWFKRRHDAGMKLTD